MPKREYSVGMCKREYGVGDRDVRRTWCGDYAVRGNMVSVWEYAKGNMVLGIELLEGAWCGDCVLRENMVGEGICRRGI
jgi:hypothetical protein